MLPPPRHEISRLESSSDALAFAVTLLLVSLDAPAFPRSLQDSSGAEATG